MADVQETLKLAVGLTRRSITLLESVGQVANAEQLRSVVEQVLDANAWLRGQEMSPEAACLAAGIPLTDQLSMPHEEVEAPPEFEMPMPRGAWQALVWPAGT